MSKRDPIYVMYNALMSIGFVATADFRPLEWRIDRIEQISSEALTEMNSEHTKKVQKALGIGE